MYAMLLNLWVTKRISASKIQSYVPVFLTQDDADMILATPQNT